jgi:hypothetical protein
MSTKKTMCKTLQRPEEDEHRRAFGFSMRTSWNIDAQISPIQIGVGADGIDMKEATAVEMSYASWQ